ncbi:hypothetical protein CGCF415_v015610 [Colletotrichum fructicola]|nr:hypothetical protein CGCF415_v015610 [Colletotrichum fructicola]KAF4921608.1 hypothetical protein CGCF245_v015556 [Colletotrichum fructicola]KAF5482936.1 hypothetical protein CGCF413_v015481 [Colletotrichum fructicola]
MYEPGQPQAEGMFEGIFDHRSEDEAVDMLSDDDSEVLELDLDDHEKEQDGFEEGGGVHLTLDTDVSCEEVPVSESVLGPSFGCTQWVSLLNPCGCNLMSFCDGTYKSALFNLPVKVSVVHLKPRAEPVMDMVVKIDFAWSLEYILMVPGVILQIITGLVVSAGLLPVSAHTYGMLRVIQYTNMVLPPSGAAGLPEEAAEDKSTAIAIACVVMSPVSKFNGSYPDFREPTLEVYNVRPRGMGFGHL